MRLNWNKVELWLVGLIAAHTVAVGAMLLAFSSWSVLVFAGWPHADPLFFPRQAGIFHFVLAFCYLWEYFRYRGIAILVVAKTLAMVFLLGATLLDHVPWVVPLSGVMDGLMGLAVVAVRRLSGRSPCRDAGPAAPH